METETTMTSADFPLPISPGKLVIDLNENKSDESATFEEVDSIISFKKRTSKETIIEENLSLIDKIQLEALKSEVINTTGKELTNIKVVKVVSRKNDVNTSVKVKVEYSSDEFSDEFDEPFTIQIDDEEEDNKEREEKGKEDKKRKGKNEKVENGNSEAEEGEEKEKMEKGDEEIKETEGGVREKIKNIETEEGEENKEEENRSNPKKPEVGKGRDVGKGKLTKKRSQATPTNTDGKRRRVTPSIQKFATEQNGKICLCAYFIFFILLINSLNEKDIKLNYNIPNILKQFQRN